MPQTVPTVNNEKEAEFAALPQLNTLGRSSSASLWHKLEHKWNEIQVGRQGSYSVERLESFNYYCKTTSRFRVVLVCVCTPIPALVAALLLECLPLRPPSEGWAANWMFWIRFSLMVFTLIFVGIVAFNQFVPNFGLTFGRRLIVSIGATTAYVGSCLLVAATNLIGFPIPFMWQIGALLVGVYTPLMFVFVFGVAPFAVNSPFRPHLRRYIVLLISYMSLGAVFPLYKLLYEHVPETYKAGALVALPMWRFAAKHFMMWTSRELEDFVPVIIALTVDFFSAMFVSVCISSSSSIYLSVLFIAVDVGQALLEFREVSNNSHTIRKLLEGETFRTPSNLLMRIVAVTRAPSEFGIVSLKRTRLWACLPHPISLEQMDNLNALETSGLYGPKGLLSSRRKRQLHNKTEKLNSIVPASISELISQNSSMTLRSDSSSGSKAKELVDQGMDLLFHCEYLALVEYVECVIPLVFATDKIVLKQLPNVNYYPGGVVKWGEAALANVIIFAMLEVGSLFLLHYFLQRKFNFSLLYQLAFALETSMNFVQSALFLEIVGLLQYELAHLGADFTFRFEWLHDSNP